MFMGQYQNSIDSKNRMIVPAKFRNQLGEGCVITVSFDKKCLTIYSTDYWEERSEKLNVIPQAYTGIHNFRRMLFSNAEVCTFDKQGRIIIPDNLIKSANIKKELVTMGVGPQIEVWAKEIWDQPENYEPVDIDSVADTLAGFGF